MDENDYHFGGLDSWIADAIQSGVNAETIHKELIRSVRRQVKFHKTCYKTSRELHKLFSNREYFDVVGDEKDILLQNKPKINSKITKINIAVPNHPDYTEL
jgi:hypothetical protein|tara:strand:- start:264 stop:566 length:303 start_codon:yes stop_codon:yes gene_type:complete